ncbi:MAG: PH domain-containing protein [Rickettsiales bacterium]|nr:PH domain-containing protein [Rickettsiales bacterium]
MPTLEEIEHQISRIKSPYIFWTRKEIKALPEILDDGEEIKALTSGMIESSTWLIVCTDRRLIFLNCGMVLGVQQIQMPLDRIQSIDHHFLLFFGSIKVYDGINVTSVGLILKSAILPFVKATQEAMYAHQQRLRAPKAPQHAPASDVASQIEKLAQLKEKGHLTEEEFQKQKQKLLA